MKYAHKENLQPKQRKIKYQDYANQYPCTILGIKHNI